MLINSPTMGDQRIGSDNYFPMGLLYMGTVLSKENVANVKIYDVNNYFYPYGKADFGWMQRENDRPKNIPFVDEEVLETYFKDVLHPAINDFKPDVIGFGAIFSGAFKGFRILARKIKDIYPDLPIITGGITTTMFAKEILRKYYIVFWFGVLASSWSILFSTISGERVAEFLSSSKICGVLIGAQRAVSPCLKITATGVSTAEAKCMIPV